MRIVSWNMNRGGRDAWSFLMDMLAPDIALLQEAVVPENLDNRYKVLWAPCLAQERVGIRDPVSI